MIQIKVSELHQGDFFCLGNRKNSKLFHAKIFEFVGGSKWQSAIEKGRVASGDVFIMGACNSPFKGQFVFTPAKVVWVPDPIELSRMLMEKGLQAYKWN